MSGGDQAEDVRHDNHFVRRASRIGRGTNDIKSIIISSTNQCWSTLASNDHNPPQTTVCLTKLYNFRPVSLLSLAPGAVQWWWWRWR